MQSLRNMFPKLRRIDINCFKAEPNEEDIQNAQNILRAFLPHVENVLLHGVPLQENLSIQHIGMTNLKDLDFYYRQNPKLDDLLTLNVERCRIRITKFSSLLVHGSLERFSDWNILLKGLNVVVERTKADDPQRLENVKRFIIENYRGVCAQVRVHSAEMVSAVTFTVSNLNRSSPEIWKF
ncbi:unnamed protein product [Caenorhabditis nigoni]